MMVNLKQNQHHLHQLSICSPGDTHRNVHSVLNLFVGSFNL